MRYKKPPAGWYAGLSATPKLTPKLNRKVTRERCTNCGGYVCTKCGVLERKYKVYEKLYGDVGEKAHQRAKEIEDFENSFV